MAGGDGYFSHIVMEVIGEELGPGWVGEGDDVEDGADGVGENEPERDEESFLRKRATDAGIGRSKLVSESDGK